MTTDDDELVDPHGELVPRIAAIVRKKQPYADWANALDDDGPRVELKDKDGGARISVYLLPEETILQSRDTRLRQCWSLIFESELALWSRRTSEWPKNRSLAMFLAWFDVEFTDSVQDLGGE